MSFTMARIRNDEFKLLITDGLYELPDLSDTEEYSATNKLDDGQWYCIKKFSSQTYAINDLPLQSSSLNLIENADFNYISYIISFQDNRYFCFQNVSKSQLLKKRVILLGTTVELKESQNLFIKNIPDALYDKDNDCLYFQNLRFIVTIFNGISKLYREATEEETTLFLDNSFINLKDGFCSEKVKVANRQRIALANDVLNKYTNKKDDLFNYINDYVPDLNYLNGKFDVSSEQDLKKLLYGIEQRFYTTPISHEKRVAKTTINLDEQ